MGEERWAVAGEAVAGEERWVAAGEVAGAWWRERGVFP